MVTTKLNKHITVIATFLFSIGLVFPMNSQAVLLEQDWLSVGDGLLTLDTSTGLEWLDLSQTDAMSYNSVVAELGIGGLYEGFRYATSFGAGSEFQSLLDSAAVTNTTGFPEPTTPDEVDRLIVLQSLLGVVNSTGLHALTDFTWDMLPNTHTALALYYLSEPTPQALVTGGHDLSVSNDAAIYSSFLVRSTSVPSPGTYSLVGLGLLIITVLGLGRGKHSATIT